MSTPGARTPLHLNERKNTMKERRLKLTKKETAILRRSFLIQSTVVVAEKDLIPQGAENILDKMTDLWIELLEYCEKERDEIR